MAAVAGNRPRPAWTAHRPNLHSVASFLTAAPAAVDILVDPTAEADDDKITKTAGDAAYSLPAKDSSIMELTHRQYKKGPSWKDLALTALFSTIIGALLTYIYRDAPFWVYWVTSQCIGLFICTLCRFSLALFNPQTSWGVAAVLVPAILTGGLVGGTVGGWLSGIEMSIFMAQKIFSMRVLVMSLLFGSIISYFFFSRDRISEIQGLLQEERIQRLTSEKHAVQSQLKVLQAQIEPHFLFNTLSNIQTLLETDAARGKTMLRDLTRYLRASLTESRSQWSTLGSEMELVNAYLNIFKVRMDDRLEVHIEMDPALKEVPFSPMLIQPLVENAVIHGLDATIEGGTIHIRAEQENGLLRVIVADTGQGLGSVLSPGLGLANIRERLQALYGREGRLIITENQPKGVKAVIEVPNGATP
jgi:sensor histidine kinase YesM